MWLFGAIGMAIFGLKAGSATDPNQLHVLFAPLFAAYGLAFVAILWSRLKFHTEIPPLRNAHFVVAILISAGPMVLDLPRQIREVGQAGDGASSLATLLSGRSQYRTGRTSPRERNRSYRSTLGGGLVC